VVISHSLVQEVRNHLCLSTFPLAIAERYQPVGGSHACATQLCKPMQAGVDRAANS